MATVCRIAAGLALGSLLTGWHYAIDGYVGFAIAAGLWYGVGWLQKWHQQRAALPA